jgi:hypothetical protein
MAWLQIASRPVSPRPFSSAIFAMLPCLAGMYILGRIVWRFPSLRVEAVGFFAVLMLALFWQLRRIRRVYAAANRVALTGVGDPLAQALNELTRTYQWGSLMFMLLSLGVHWAYSSLR